MLAQHPHVVGDRVEVDHRLRQRASVTSLVELSAWSCHLSRLSQNRAGVPRGRLSAQCANGCRLSKCPPGLSSSRLLQHGDHVVLAAPGPGPRRSPPAPRCAARRRPSAPSGIVYAGTCQPKARSACGDVELGVAEVAGEPEADHRDRRSVGDHLEVLAVAQLVAEPARGVRQALHHLGVAGAAQPQEVVVLADDLVAGREKFSVNVGMSPPR